MVDLFYLSHTAVPAHLGEVEGLGLLEPDEQILVALDGVLLDSTGRRIGGPTLHDYCLLTNRRILLWARDYGRHLCYGFPLTELCVVEGSGLDPMHAHLHLAFAAPGEEEQHFALILLPLVDLSAAVTLLRLSAQTALEFAEQGFDVADAAPEITYVLEQHIFGSTDGKRPSVKSHRRTDSDANIGDDVTPPFPYEPTNLPSEFYSAGRLGRAAWDTLRRTLREAELPRGLAGGLGANELHELLNGGDLRGLAETLRALNDLLSTLAGNPDAREVAMAFLSNRRGGGGGSGGGGGATGSPKPSTPPMRYTSPTPSQQRTREVPSEPVCADDEPYHEIPLRRRSSAKRTAEKGDTSSVGQNGIPLRRRGETKRTAPGQESPTSDRVEIPLRRRGSTKRPNVDET